MTRTRWREYSSVTKFLDERIDHFGADFITTRSSRSPDRDAQVRGVRAVFVTHPLDADDDRARQCSAPTRMDRGKRARTLVAHQDRNAVGRLHAGQHA